MIANTTRIFQVVTDLAEMYEIPLLLTPDECKTVIQAIDKGLTPSTVTHGPNDYRTSRTCHLPAIDPDLARMLDDRLAKIVNIDPKLSEPIQGQRYDVGQYFKAHTDWFTPGTPEYQEHTAIGGQRTWTVMVYLNNVEEGGQTTFEKIGRTFSPHVGDGLAWNNLHRNGEPNHATLHEAMPVEKGVKYVITKWFRSEPGRSGL